MKHYVGLDVSLKEVSICGVDADGAVVGGGKAATDPARVLSWIQDNVGALERIVHESGPLSIWPTRELAALGAPVVCIDARAARKALSARRNKSDRTDAEALAQVRRLLDGMPRGQRGLFEVLDRGALDRLGTAPEAALGLALEPGVDVTSSPAGPVVRAAEGATHGFLPDASPQIYTGLVASGAGIRRGASAPRLRLTDVAPLVAHLLGLRMPAGDGVMPAGFLDEPPE